MGDFYGLKTGSIRNPFLEMEYLEETGPRIVRLLRTQSEINLLAETPEYGWETRYGWYGLHGGHRLWHAPQSAARSSVPEGQDLRVEVWDGGVRLVQPADAHTGISKAIEIQMEPSRPSVVVRHRLMNQGVWPVELAAWAITQVPLGGRMILPQAAAPADPKASAPNRNLVFWPYDDLPDSRLQIGNDYFVFDALQNGKDFKLGYYNPRGWIGYRYGDVFFRKRFFPQAGQSYPDLGCNVEIYSNGLFAELETLGPLLRLEPGASVYHTEIWDIFTLDQARPLLGEQANLLDPSSIS